MLDAQQGAIPGVTVSVRNIDTGFTRDAVTSSDGRYRIAAVPPALPPGRRLYFSNDKCLARRLGRVARGTVPAAAARTVGGGTDGLVSLPRTQRVGHIDRDQGANRIRP